MYLFLQGCNITGKLCKGFTFHNVSISTHLDNPEKQQYDPLHSTMYLFLLRQASVCDAGIGLYIPQCIYFYFYADLIFNLFYHFTFHNVSISTCPIFSLSNTVITSPVLSTSFLISILSQIYTCDNIHFTYHAL